MENFLANYYESSRDIQRWGFCVWCDGWAIQSQVENLIYAECDCCGARSPLCDEKAIAIQAFKMTLEKKIN